MPSLKEIRTRIHSVQSTRKITSAMKMVAASRLRKVQNNINHLRQYSWLLKKLLNEVMDHVPASAYGPFLRERNQSEVLIVSLGSNKGLCGTYNAFLIKHTLREVNALREQDLKVSLMPIGHRMDRFFSKRDDLFCHEADHGLMERLDYLMAVELADQVMDLFLRKNFSRVLFVYNRFKNAVVHQLTTEQVLPVPRDEIITLDESIVDPMDEMPVILEPDQEAVLHYMSRKHIYYSIYRIMLDAAASEHGSRMTAMHKATDNADEMLKSLKLSYNKARQAAVTRELLDIVGGARKRGA